MSSLSLTTLVAAPLDVVFDLSLSVDAHTASMSSSRERVIGGVASGTMRAGDTVTWRARHFGIPFTMTSVISSYRRPYAFVDEQVRGPFRRWRHEHLFFEDGQAQTVMVDNVDFTSPVGPIGSVVDRLVLERYLRSLLEQRNQWLAGAVRDRGDQRRVAPQTPPGPVRGRCRGITR